MDSSTVGRKAEETGDPLSQWGMHLFRSRVFIVPRKGDSSTTENGRRNFDNIQRQVRRLRQSGGDGVPSSISPVFLIEYVGK